jgi:hypothetical protein
MRDLRVPSALASVGGAFTGASVGVAVAESLGVSGPAAVMYIMAAISAILLGVLIVVTRRACLPKP